MQSWSSSTPSRTIAAQEQRGSVQSEILDTKKQLDELLDRIFYSAIEVPDIKHDMVKDFDPYGKEIMRQVNIETKRYLKLPSAVKIISCDSFGIELAADEKYKDETGETVEQPTMIEYDEDKENEALRAIKEMKKHLKSVHDLDLNESAIGRHGIYRDWRPIVNRAGLNFVKSTLLALAAPLFQTTNYQNPVNSKNPNAGSNKLERITKVETKALMYHLIQNRFDYNFNCADGTKIKTLTAFFYDLILAVKLNSLGGFKYKGIVTTSTEEKRVLETNIPRGSSPDWKDATKGK